MYFEFDNKQPRVGENTYVSETSQVIGDVRIGNRCYIGHGVILRGDYGTIEIGDESIIEEGVIVHAPPGDICSISCRVTIGHGAIIHAAYIGDLTGIGMGAILSIRSKIGSKSIVAEGTVVRKEQNIPDSVIVAGNPARKIKDVTKKEIAFWDYGRSVYRDLAEKYCNVGIKKIELIARSDTARKI